MATNRPANKVILRSWPGMVFMWPSALLALAAGIVTYLNPDDLASGRVWGGAFLVVFALNLMVITFEFPRSTSLTLVLFCIALTWLFVELNRRYNLIRPLQEFIASLDVTATPDFYFFLFTVYLILFVAMFIGTRFNYWELTSNELVHHKGMMRDVDRYATAGLKYHKQITDFFEYILAGAGQLTFEAPAMNQTVVLANVLGINRVARRLDALLEVERVAGNTELVQPAAPHA